MKNGKRVNLVINFGYSLALAKPNKIEEFPFWIIATLDLEERLILEDGPSGLIKSDLTDRPPTPTHPPPPLCRWIV